MSLVFEIAMMFIIGFPVWYGWHLRKKTYMSPHYIKTFHITVIIFSIFGIGYIALETNSALVQSANIYNEHNFLFFIAIYGNYLLYQYIYSTRVEFKIIPFILSILLSLFLFNFFSYFGQDGIKAYLLLNYLGLLILIGAFHALLGTIISGVNVAVLFYSLYTESNGNLFLWASVFDFFNISNIYIQWLFFGISTILGFISLVNLDEFISKLMAHFK